MKEEKKKMSKALFVIDMQETTVGKNHAKMFNYDDSILSSVNSTIESTDADCIVYIRNLMKKNIINRLAPVKCFDGTDAAELVEGLTVVGDNIYSKYEGNAFSNKDLCSLLEKQGITEIEIVGVDGGGCVALSALGAVKLGYKVTLITKSIGTVFEKKQQRYFMKLKEKGAIFV